MAIEHWTCTKRLKSIMFIDNGHRCTRILLQLVLAMPVCRKTFDDYCSATFAVQRPFLSLNKMENGQTIHHFMSVGAAYG